MKTAFKANLVRSTSLNRNCNKSIHHRKIYLKSGFYALKECEPIKSIWIYDEYDYRKHIGINHEKWVILSRSSRKSDFEKRFKDLASKWDNETGFYSTIQQKVYNQNYLSIISMGEEAVPLMLNDIKNGGTWHWHTALCAITDLNPVPLIEMSNPKKIKQAWIKWGESKNLI